ncbi:MAG: site-specific DNA-methyltransferase, partial [Methylococcales bacterium]
GDNLQALKALLPLYAGKVKCIYIDPPYNTRSAFMHYDDNLEHSLWLSMMYPRLELLRELLAEDGSIWVNLDDNEAHYAKVMLDEIMGRKNFVQSITWNRKVSPANDATWFSNDHDHILVYAKNKQNFIINRLEREEKHNKSYTNPDNDERGAWNSVTFTGNKTKDERPNLFYPVINPNTLEEIWPPKGLTWRASNERANKLLADNLLYWGKDGKSKSPRMKNFLDAAKPVVPRSVWFYDDVGHTQEAMTEQKVMFETPFGTPKPERLIQRIFEIATNPNDLVLDSFLGSGTTAAVAHKMNRRYIGIEMGDHAETHCQPRLKKVIEGEQGGISKDVHWQGGGGFHYFRLGETIFDELGSIHPDVRFPALAAHIWFCETRSPLAKPADSALLGIHNGTAYYLLYNGILGDRRPQSGNVLTQAVLDVLPKHAGRKIIYGEASRFGKPRLDVENIIFKQIPYDVRAV